MNVPIEAADKRMLKMMVRTDTGSEFTKYLAALYIVASLKQRDTLKSGFPDTFRAYRQLGNEYAAYGREGMQ